MSAIAVIPGDGIGNEVIPEAVRALKTLNEVTGMGLQYETFDYGAERYLRTGKAVPDNVTETVQKLARDFDAILFGAAGDDPRVPPEGTSRPILRALRYELDLYANLRPCKLYDARLTPLKGKTEADIDFVVFRECTEGFERIGGNLKSGTPDEVAIREEISTWKGVHRMIKFAFEYAKRHKLSRVTTGEKVAGDNGIWVRVLREVAKDYPGIQAQNLHIDTLVYLMVISPEQFQVIVLDNRSGDIVSDLAAALHGSRGLSPSGVFNAEKKICYFEPVHGTAPDIAGQSRSNPFAAILAARMMLDHLGFQEPADLLERAVVKAIKEGKTTADIGGKLGTTQAGESVCQNIRKLAR